MTVTSPERFRKMADAIESNAERGFGGAFVIMPPEGDPIETLILDSKQDPSQFYMLLKTKCDIALNELDAKQTQAQGFQRR